MNSTGNSNKLSTLAVVGAMLTTAGLVWSITWAVTSARLVDQDKRLTKTEQAVDQYREFRGEMRSDMSYVKGRLDEVVSLVRDHVGER